MEYPNGTPNLLSYVQFVNFMRSIYDLRAMYIRLNSVYYPSSSSSFSFSYIGIRSVKYRGEEKE